MSKLYRLLFTIIVSLLLLSCGKADYIDTAGNSGKYSDHQGQWMIINYWAIWCKPCIEEIPELNQFAILQAGKVILFAVDFDQNQGEKLKENSQKLGIEFPVLTSDPAEILGFEHPKVLPTTLIFNPEGKLERTLIGPQTVQSLQQAINR